MSLLPGRPNLGRGTRPPAGGGRRIEGRDVALTVAVIVAAFLLMTIVQSLIFGYGEDRSSSDLRIQVVVSLAFSSFAFLGAFYVVLIRAKGYRWEDFGVRPLAPHWRRVAVLTAVLMVPAALVLAQFLLRETDAEPQALTRAIADGGFTLVTAIALFLYVALLQPLAEELIFRGMLFGWLRQTQGYMVANVLSAAAFAILHRQLLAIVITFLLALVLGWLRERSGSLLAPILTHQVYNAIMLGLTLVASLSTSQPA